MSVLVSFTIILKTLVLLVFQLCQVQVMWHVCFLQCFGTVSFFVVLLWHNLH